MKTIDPKKLEKVTGGARPIPNPLPDSSSDPARDFPQKPWGFR